MFDYKDKLMCTTAKILLMLHINRTFLHGKDVWWCWYQGITGIVHGTDAKNRAVLYGYHDYSQFSDSQNAEFALFTLIKCTHLDIQDAASLHMVHILQHPTSLPITVNTKYNGQCSKTGSFPSPRRQIWQISNALHMTTSSSESREVRVGGRKGPSPWSIASWRFKKKPAAEK